VQKICARPNAASTDVSAGEPWMIYSTGNDARDNGSVLAVTDRVNRAAALFLAISIH
jgi:hypothetical protein